MPGRDRVQADSGSVGGTGLCCVFSACEPRGQVCRAIRVLPAFRPLDSWLSSKSFRPRYPVAGTLRYASHVSVRAVWGRTDTSLTNTILD